MWGLAAVLAMSLLSTTACLITDPIEVYVPEPPAPNHPPRIVEEHVRPSGWAPIVLDGSEGGCEALLKVGVVEDEDVEDELSAVWFVDYDPNGINPVYPGGVIQKSGEVQRVGGPAAEFRFQIGDRFPATYHVVTIVVSDGFAGLPGDPTKVKEGKASVSYTWTIDATGAATCTGARQ